MPDLFLDPRLPDYFDEIDLSAPAEAARVMPAFLQSRIVALRNVGLDKIDLPFLQRIAFPQTWEMKKFQFRAFVEHHRNGAAPHADVLQACGGDRGRLKELARQFEALQAVVDAALARILPGATLGKTIHVARFSETRMENLHFDLDPDCEECDAVRLYINLDSAPRIWATSWQMHDLAQRVAGRIKAETYREKPIADFVKQLSTRAFGGWHNRADERESPRHMLYFEPGDVWIVDGRSLAHQVLFGQRVISIYARVPYATNAYAPTFLDKARAALETAASAPPPGVAPIAVKGPVHAAGDLKANWSEVFGKPEAGRLRRFTGEGQLH